MELLDYYGVVLNWCRSSFASFKNSADNEGVCGVHRENGTLGSNKGAHQYSNKDKIVAAVGWSTERYSNFSAFLVCI